MHLRNLFPIKIHCWGGFGSQLYALSLLIDLAERFPKRQSRIIFHTGGVSHRNPEVLELMKGQPYEIFEDFYIQDSVNNGVGKKKTLHLSLQIVASRLLILSGFLARANTDQEFSRLKPWVVSLRGHYSYRKQRSQTIRIIFGETLDSEFEVLDSVGIQYRLGDLLQLESKSPVEAIRVATVTKKVNPDKALNCYLFSDSVEVARRMLFQQGVDSYPVILDSLATVIQLSKYKIFIGTSSKISFWVVLLRMTQNNLKFTYMPSSDSRQLLLNIGDSFAEGIEYF
jgi:hypothetical protein